MVKCRIVLARKDAGMEWNRGNLIMGWNDHDDRLMAIADILEGYGMEYTRAYEKALEIRTEEMLGAEYVSEMALAQIGMDG
jgi:hypothetical protein